MQPLPFSFYARNTLTVAKELLGKYLVHKTKEGKTTGKIVETEAYTQLDEASHSFNGKTKRTEVMFDKPGKAYIYFIYGMYYCFNVVTNKKDIGDAILIRALEPVEGIELMKKRRNKEKLKDLCSGPAKLVQALGIKKKQNGLDLSNKNSNLFITDDALMYTNTALEIIKTTRVGITKAKNLKYRFYIKGNKFISRK